MKAQPAFVGADGAVHLNAIAAIDLNFTAIGYPGYAKRDQSVGLYHAQEDVLAFVSRVFGDKGDDGFSDLFDRLHKLRFVLISQCYFV